MSEIEVTQADIELVEDIGAAYQDYYSSGRRSEYEAAQRIAAHFRIAACAEKDARIAELEKAIVIAAIPLEAIIASGTEVLHCQEIRDAIHDAVSACRVALKDQNNG